MFKIITSKKQVFKCALKNIELKKLRKGGTKMKPRIFFTISGIFFMLNFIPVHAISPDSLKIAITNHFKLTTRSFFGRIKVPGTVLVLQKEGLRADPAQGIMVPSVIKDGHLVRVGSDFGYGHSLKVGEQLYLYRVNVNKDHVILLIATVETFDIIKEGTTHSQPYELAVSFQYENGIDNLSAEQILNDIYVWFKPLE